ncbi:hypothetical protein ACOBM3_09885 [Enterobacter hormaechei]|uniref:hypothetical protein n=2 Tax=Enterobacter hormaechei TaxID=158836 RepID=UPI00300CFC07
MSMSKVVLAGLLLASVSVHAEETRSFKCGDYTVMTKWAKEGRFRKMTVLKGDDVVAMEDSTEPVMNNGIGNVITVQNSEVDLKNVSYLFIEQTTKGKPAPDGMDKWENQYQLSIIYRDMDVEMKAGKDFQCTYEGQ